MANVNTIGFKPDVAAFQARFSEAIQQGDVAPGSRTRDDIGGGVKVIETLTDFAPGRLQQTGNKTDVAIIGEGFFQVAGPDNEPLLTRAGAFRLDNDGRLLTVNGHEVLADGGSGIQLDVNLPWSVSKEGFVEQGGGQVPLALVQPASLDELTKVGGNLFRARGTVQPVEAAAREVRAEYLEMSASNQVEQMMSMIEVTRAFEANTRMIQAQDSTMGNLVGRVLRAG